MALPHQWRHATSCRMEWPCYSWSDAYDLWSSWRNPCHYRHLLAKQADSSQLIHHIPRSLANTCTLECHWYLHLGGHGHSDPLKWQVACSNCLGCLKKRLSKCGHGISRWCPHVKIFSTGSFIGRDRQVQQIFHTVVWHSLCSWPSSLEQHDWSGISHRPSIRHPRQQWERRYRCVSNCHNPSWAN